MIDTPRSKPYIWATWLAGYLAGDACKWKTWYRAHFKYEKLQDPEKAAFLAEWTKKHDDMVQRFLEECNENLEWSLLEDDAKFTIKGKVADLSGKPDLVVKYKNLATPIILEFKTGIQRDSDFAQARIYQFALTKSRMLKLDDGCYPDASVVYRSGPVEVTYYVDEEHLIVDAIKKIGSEYPLRRVPSVKECSRCDIRTCPDRIRETELKTEEF